MSEATKMVPVLAEPVEQRSARKLVKPSGRPRTQKALELIAMRGREVVGVRHLLPGGTAWVGNSKDVIARLPMKEFGGQPLIIGEATRDEFAINIPPRARARVHGPGGVPRLLVGPYKITLTPGERAVLVLGQVQIRAQIVDLESFATPTGSSVPGGLAAWVAFTAAIYVAALAVCAALAPAPAQRLEHGAMHRMHEPVLAKVALGQ